jgi:hypothetical protein
MWDSGSSRGLCLVSCVYRSLEEERVFNTSVCDTSLFSCLIYSPSQACYIVYVLILKSIVYSLRSTLSSSLSLHLISVNQG